ncbi:8905_t:CDS:2, partial [Entrophospora sp. SA101]
HALKLVWAGTKIKALNVLEDVELRNGIKEYSNWPTIPQVYVKAEFVGDCDIKYGTWTKDYTAIYLKSRLTAL